VKQKNAYCHDDSRKQEKRQYPITTLHVR